MSGHVTVVLVVHDETTVCGPTMRAADLAVAAARARGLAVQEIIALDAPTDDTSAYFGQSRFDQWERRVTQTGDIGRVRNALARETTGSHIAFLGAHDLVSENWLAEGVATLSAALDRGERVIAHPELTVDFDGSGAVQINIDQSSPLFTSHYLYFRDYYEAPCLAPRAAHLEVPYRSHGVHHVQGQDHRFTIETLAAGWRHVVVKDTIIFKRHTERAKDKVGESPGPTTGAPPGLAIDRVRGLGRQP